MMMTMAETNSSTKIMGPPCRAPLLRAIELANFR
jgi:hypothetical protein